MHIIREQANELIAAISALQVRDEVLQHCSTVKQLHINADGLANSAIAQLFEFEADAIQLIELRSISEGCGHGRHPHFDEEKMVDGIARKFNLMDRLPTCRKRICSSAGASASLIFVRLAIS